MLVQTADAGNTRSAEARIRDHYVISSAILFPARYQPQHFRTLLFLHARSIYLKFDCSTADRQTSYCAGAVREESLMKASHAPCRAACRRPCGERESFARTRQNLDPTMF